MTPVAQEIRPRFIATERRLKLVFHTVVNKEQVAAGQGRLFQGQKNPGPGPGIKDSGELIR